MKICYRDEIGLVTVEVDTIHSAGVAFDGSAAYFTDTNGNDCKVALVNIVFIGYEN